MKFFAKKVEIDKNLPYWDTNLSFEERAKDLVSRMTLKEKISQTLANAKGIPHLGVQKHNYWNECLHGVARAGIATVFPQAIGLAATFNPELIFKMATVISTEARAKHHEAVRNNEFGRYKGLTFWSPNINIFRDPRWGRGQETYGEDPYLTGRLGVSFVKGLQGNDPKYLKIVATPKHYAVHSGPEKNRHEFNAIATPKDLRETYLPHFKECVQEANAYSIMGAYNRTNGEPCCASPTLLQKILREEWGFDGFVVSDCGAISDFHRHHKITNNAAESAALGIKEGCDLNCGITYKWLKKAFKKGLVTEEDIEKAVTRLMLARMKLGMFDSPEIVEYAKIPFSKNDCDEHREMALKVARQSIVLLKNKDNILPISQEIKNIACIGPNCDSLDVLLGNYEGTPSKYYTLLSGLKNRCDSSVKIEFEQGCKLKGGSDSDFDAAIELANKSDLIIMGMGISPKMEGEQRGPIGSDDRENLALPEIQQELLQKIKATGKPIILVLFNGSPMSINWAQDNINGILEAWYPGEEGGNALADIILGNYSPGGRLPITFVKSVDDLPPLTDYKMKGRTYRYSEVEPLYPFGYGLSYTKFDYSDLQLNKTQIKPTESLEVKITIKNSGDLDGEEVVQLYLRDNESSFNLPKYSLKGVKRIFLKKGEQMQLLFKLSPRDLAIINNSGACILEPGQFTIWIGGHQPDKLSAKLTNTKLIESNFEVIGSEKHLKY